MNLLTGPTTFLKNVRSWLYLTIARKLFTSSREIISEVRRTVVLKYLIGPIINHEYGLKITLGVWSGNIEGSKLVIDDNQRAGFLKNRRIWRIGEFRLRCYEICCFGL